LVGGILISVSTTSGRSRSTAACSESRSLHVATSSSSSTDWRSSRMPSRIRKLSSASTTLIGIGQRIGLAAPFPMVQAPLAAAASRGYAAGDYGGARVDLRRPGGLSCSGSGGGECDRRLSGGRRGGERRGVGRACRPPPPGPGSDGRPPSRHRRAGGQPSYPRRGRQGRGGAPFDL